MESIAFLLICLMAAVQVFSQGKTALSIDAGKMHQLKYCLFFENHTIPACPDVGENFNAEAFTDRIKRCGVDYLTFYARYNSGMAYYNMKIGIKHPQIRLFGKLAGACKQKGSNSLVVFE